MIPGQIIATDPIKALPKTYCRIFFNQFLKFCNDRTVFTRSLFIALCTGTQMNSLTRLTLANTMGVDHMVCQAVFLIRR
jgi:hypothetical protein